MSALQCTAFLQFNNTLVVERYCSCCPMGMMTEEWRKCHEKKLPVNEGLIEQLLRNPSIVRIVTIMDTDNIRLSAVELMRLGVSKIDISYALANGVIELDPIALSMTASPEIVERIANDSCYYYDYLNSRKLRLTEGLGLLILEILASGEKEGETEGKFYPKDVIGR